MGDAFVDWVAPRAEAAGVPFVDYRAAARPGDFATNSRGDPDAIHLTPAGLDAFAPVLAAAVADRIESRTR